MSLQVWLPLTKDLRQQGLSDAVVGSSTAVFNSAGKLGGCYTFTNQIITVTPTTSLKESFGSAASLACWVKLSSSHNSWAQCLTFGVVGTAWTQIYFGIDINSSGIPYVNVANGSNNTNCSSNTAIKDGNWHHICATFITGTIKIYIDGMLKNSASTSYTPAWANATVFSIGGNSSEVFKNGDAINDVRLYNHCLSLMEIKELSKGLVLHYPLNRGGFGIDNLMPNSIEMPEGSANPSTGTWRLAGSSQMTRSRVAISDAPSGASTYGFQSIGLQTGQDASCWGIDSFPRENGTTYTLSAWGRIVGGSSTAAMLGFSVYSGTTLDYGGTYGKATSSDAKYYGSGAYDYAGGQLNPNGSWTRVYRTFTSTSTSDNIYIGFNTAKTGNNVTLQLCGVKLEKGDKMTPWTPNSNESMYTTLGLNGTTEYDCSGFSNNGEKISTLTYTSDTPKYSISTYFNESTSKIKFPIMNFSGMSATYTFTWWQYLAKDSSMIFGFADGNLLNLYNESIISWNIYDGTANAFKNNGSTVSISQILNKWVHMAVTGDGTNVKLYINGEYRGTAPTWRPLTGTQIYISGNNASTSYHIQNSKISDFRIYATALSADDVKSLYQNSAYIDSSGNVYGAVHSEV